MMDPLHEEQRLTLLAKFSRKAAAYHEHVPILGKVPFRSVAIIALLVFVNIGVWIGCGIVLVRDRYSLEITSEH